MTKGQMEAKISEALIKFEKEIMGRGPRETVSHIIKDAIFVRLKGVLTPAEEQLAKTSEGAKLINCWAKLFLILLAAKQQVCIQIYAQRPERR